MVSGLDNQIATFLFLVVGWEEDVRVGVFRFFDFSQSPEIYPTSCNPPALGKMLAISGILVGSMIGVKLPEIDGQWTW